MPTEYVPCASGCSRWPVPFSMRPTFALIETSTSPEAIPHAQRASTSAGSVVARPGSSVATANAAQPTATARAPKRSIARGAMRNITGIEPTLTNSIATPSAPFDAPVATWTLGSTAAQAPQKSPSARNPASVGPRRGSSEALSKACV